MTEGKKQSKKRFIAGAVCPRCGAMDRIIMYRKDDKDYRECVSCDFSDEMHIKPVARELETRVNKTEEEKQAEVQVLHFPASGSNSSEESEQ